MAVSNLIPVVRERALSIRHPDSKSWKTKAACVAVLAGIFVIFVLYFVWTSHDQDELFLVPRQIGFPVFKPIPAEPVATKPAGTNPIPAAGPETSESKAIADYRKAQQSAVQAREAANSAYVEAFKAQYTTAEERFEEARRCLEANDLTRASELFSDAEKTFITILAEVTRWKNLEPIAEEYLRMKKSYPDGVLIKHGGAEYARLAPTIAKAKSSMDVSALRVAYQDAIAMLKEERSDIFYRQACSAGRAREFDEVLEATRNALLHDANHAPTLRLVRRLSEKSTIWLRLAFEEAKRSSGRDAAISGLVLMPLAKKRNATLYNSIFEWTQQSVLDISNAKLGTGLRLELAYLQFELGDPQFIFTLRETVEMCEMITDTSSKLYWFEIARFARRSKQDAICAKATKLAEGRLHRNDVKEKAIDSLIINCSKIGPAASIQRLASMKAHDDEKLLAFAAIAEESAKNGDVKGYETACLHAFEHSANQGTYDTARSQAAFSLAHADLLMNRLPAATVSVQTLASPSIRVEMLGQFVCKLVDEGSLHQAKSLYDRANQLVLDGAPLGASFLRAKSALVAIEARENPANLRRDLLKPRIGPIQVAVLAGIGEAFRAKRNPSAASVKEAKTWMSQMREELEPARGCLFMAFMQMEILRAALHEPEMTTHFSELKETRRALDGAWSKCFDARDRNDGRNRFSIRRDFENAVTSDAPAILELTLEAAELHRKVGEVETGRQMIRDCVRQLDIFSPKSIHRARKYPAIAAAAKRFNEGQVAGHCKSAWMKYFYGAASSAKEFDLAVSLHERDYEQSRRLLTEVLSQKSTPSRNPMMAEMVGRTAMLAAEAGDVKQYRLYAARVRELAGNSRRSSSYIQLAESDALLGKFPSAFSRLPKYPSTRFEQSVYASVLNHENEKTKDLKTANYAYLEGMARARGFLGLGEVVVRRGDDTEEVSQVDSKLKDDDIASFAFRLGLRKGRAELE